MFFFKDRDQKLHYLLPFSLLFLLFGCGGGGGSASVTPSSDQSRVEAATTSAESGTNTALPSAPSPEAKEITLQWLSPTTRQDGTPLSMSEIAGYRIYYSETSGNYNTFVYVKGAYEMSVTIEGLKSGRYFLAMTTLDDHGLESDLSGEIIIDV